MAYTKDIDDANAYFGAASHVRTYDWLNYSTAERTAALAQAEREIELFINRDLSDPADTDRFRDDYAVFEQALWLLDETVRTKQSENSAQLIETVDSEERDNYYGITLCPMAQKFLARQKIRIARGA